MYMQNVGVREIRYIKLGRGGCWENVSIGNGEIHFGFGGVPHELARTGDREAIVRSRLGRGRDARAASEDTREILDFYRLGADCLWITFARDHLWYAQATPQVEWLGGDGTRHGMRMRRTLSGWSNLDALGRPLRIDALSTRLTKAQSYRRTICRIKEQEYLLRRIAGQEEPIVQEANAAMSTLVSIAAKAMTRLHWADFETLVDLIFVRSGWRRVSALGGTQKSIDLELEQPTTAERAMVQVKSSASQRVLDDYLDRFQESGRFERLFFVCHSPVGAIRAPESPAVHVWNGEELARRVVQLGLHEWLFQRVA
jgi:hypothetical protein